MNLDTLNTIASYGADIIFLATALAALIQLRHLRSANDLQGLLKVLEMAYQPAIQEAFDFVTHEYPEKIKDPAFRRELLIHPIDSHVHKELIAIEYYERLGSYVKNHLIPADLYLDCSSPSHYWNTLAPVVATLRQKHGPASYENFEYLVAREHEWDAAHPNGNYPADTQRLPLPPPISA
jgi:hypothetical protein